MFSTILVLLGLVVAVSASLWLVVVAFEESVWWGLGCLLVPFVSLVFVMMFWEKAGRPFLWSLGGVALMIGASIVRGAVG